MNELNYSLVKLYFPVSTSSSEDDEDPALLQREYFPELSWAFSMTYLANHFPNKSEDLPEGIKPALHYLAYSPTEGILLCVGYDFKNDILRNASPEPFKDALKKIVDNIDGQFCDGWGENGFQFKHKDKYISASFRSDLALIVTDVFNVSSMHIRWDSISEIEHLDWVINYRAYEWLYRGMRYYGQSQEQLDYLTAHKDHYFFA